MNFVRLGQRFAPLQAVRGLVWGALRPLGRWRSAGLMPLRRLSLRQRLLVTFLPIVVLGGVSQVIIAGRQIQSVSVDFFRTQVEAEAVKVASSLSEPMEHYLEGEGTWEIQEALAVLQFDSAWHYLLLDSSRRIVAYTLGDGYEAKEVATLTTELSQAARGRVGVAIRSFIDDEDYLFVATPIYYEQSIIGYFVLSRSLAPIYGEIQRQWLELGMASLPVVLLIIAASLWIANTILQPLEVLRGYALSMARGELGVKIPVEREDEIGDLSQSFNYMSQQLEKILTAQRSFVNNAAHELRNPLMTMKLRLDAIAHDGLDEEQRRQYLAELRQEVGHMAELVTSLLTLARIDEGRHRADGVIEDTTVFLRDMSRNWRIKAQQAGLGYQADIALDLPPLTISDSDLRLVLNNLLGNAIKYTQEGEVGWSAHVEGEEVVIKVWDTGVGFEPTQAERLFERFYRDDGVRHAFEGHGLGLAIVKAVLEAHGATITAHSEGRQRGAQFVVRLPLRR